MLNEKILTIDGASGVGKGTIAKIIANQQNWNLLDSGAIYRVFALQTTFTTDHSQTNLKQIATKLDLQFIGETVLLNNIDVSQKIRTEEIGNLASKFAKIDFIRASLLQRQRDFATEKGLVADGRDMATVVFPQAKFQVFLTASIEERVKRRVKQLQINNNYSKIDEVFHTKSITSSIIERDKRDKNRNIAPLVPSKNAFIIDTSALTIDEVVIKINDYMKNK